MSAAEKSDATCDAGVQVGHEQQRGGVDDPAGDEGQHSELLLGSGAGVQSSSCSRASAEAVIQAGVSFVVGM